MLSAYANAQSVSEGFMGLVPLIIIFVLFYFLMIRPQIKQAKTHKAMLEDLKKGDNVVTQSGILGKIVKVTDDIVELEIASNTVIRVQKIAIQNKLTS